ncbi:hypothetical protein PMG11_02232 [Penicillium brasilianum]|uniref:Uncharacterized protein n=1 Tax=Penicillium brasilianum TaxID=104259 RepID=A0A0F7THJ7_PENBI|nr:hypothetical protein PMG11_02232 [Penicillium brasilianum]
MTTRTQLQTHFGRLMDLASQPSPPLKPTFWDNLDLDGRKASVSQDRSWEFNKEFAWDPIGSVKDEWNDSIYPRTIKPLLQHNTRKIYHGVKKQTPYSVCCWMIGKEWHLSYPAAIIICGNKKVTKNAVKLIERHGELVRTWGFRVYGYESKVSLTMGTSGSDIDEGSPLCAISGTRFTIRGSDGMSSRIATLGGSIMIDGEFFGVTVAHPFMEISQALSSDEDGSDMSDNDSDISDCISCTDATESIPIESVMPESEVALVEDPISHQETILGTIPNQSYFSQNADWALIELRPAALAINLLALGDKTVIPCRIQRYPADGELWVAVNPAGPVQTKASPSICGLFVPFSGMQDVWATSLKPTPGYCGSWIVDASQQAICGIIVAGSESNDISFALSAWNIFEEIQARFPLMKLQSLKDIVTLPVQHFTNIIRKAKELGLSHFVSEMVSKRPGLNEMDSSGYSPLCWAIQEGYEAVVASLLGGGASPHVIGAPLNLSPLELAVQKGHVAIVQLILSSGADPNSPTSSPRQRTPLIIAAERGHRDLTILLIMSGSSVNTYDAFGSGPLAVAARYGDEEVIRILLSRGATVDAADSVGVTPLMQAVMSQNEKATSLLLENGANVNCFDYNGYTPLLFTAMGGDAVIARILLEGGANQLSRLEDGDTPLIIAAKNGHDQVVEALLEQQNGPDIPNERGDTPLMMAVMKGHVPTVEILLRHGADMHIRNLFGHTPWSLAQGDDDMTNLLRDHSASQDHKGKGLSSIIEREPRSKNILKFLSQRSSNISESGQEKKQKEKRKFEESIWNMDEFMAEPEAGSHREPK